MNSWEKFIIRIKSAINELNNPNVIWYRGHTVDHKIIPSLYRFDSGKKNEKYLFNKYFQSVPNSPIENNKSDWNILFDMQQYYIPTRLIDWTETLEVAIFFALLKESFDCAIYLLDPISLNNLSNLKDIIRIDNKNKFEYRDLFWRNKPFKPKFPIAIEPQYDDITIQVKKRLFTIHGDNIKSLEIQCPQYIRKITLHNDVKKYAKEYLISLDWYN